MEINKKLLPQEKVLYNNATGTNGTVTLSETSENFKFIEILFRSGYLNNYSSVKIYNPNGKTVDLTNIQITGSVIYFRYHTCTINGLNITRNTGYSMNSSVTYGTLGVDTDYAPYITQVIGYY